MFCLCSLHPGVSLVGTAAWSCLVIHPVFLCVTHSMTAGDLARRAGSVERTGARAVAESLSAVAALARVPVIDDHLRRHLASPNASGALLLVGSWRLLVNVPREELRESAGIGRRKALKKDA